MAKKPCGTWKITDIPKESVSKVVSNFRLQNPDSVKKEEQADGKWTVTAVFPDCPPGKANVTETTHNAA